MLHCLSCIDPALGRLDYTLLSDQTCFEILFDGCTAEQKKELGIIKNENEIATYPDVCDWKGAECDEEGNVLKMKLWSMSELGPHRLRFGYIPSKLISFALSFVDCDERIRMSDLPQTLERFDIRYSKVLCTLEVKDIPRNLLHFSVTDTLFEGTCDLKVLPGHIEEFTVQEGYLTGKINLMCLPSTLKILNLQKNMLDGPIHITELPGQILRLDLSYNNFHGSCVITCIPQSLRILSVYENKLTGTAILLKAVNGNNCCVLLEDNELTALKDEKGRKHRFSRRIMKHQRK